MQTSRALPQAVSRSVNEHYPLWLDLTTPQLGNLVGCLLAAFFGDKLGRKNTLRVGAALSTTGAILQFLSWHFPQFIVGRVINGFGNGKKLKQPNGQC